MTTTSSPKVQRAWAMYDWANSAYNLVITATIFPIYFKNVTPEYLDVAGYSLRSTAVYDFALAFAYLLISCLMPLLSGIADYGGSKKRFMQFFTTLGSVSCALMFLFTSQSVWLGLGLVIAACIGYTGSLVFYNAYLPEIAPPEEHDRLSARGFAMGYFGSSLLLILNLLLIMKPEWFGLLKPDGTPNTGLATRISFLSVGIWWFGFALIPFTRLPGNLYNKKPQGRYLVSGYLELLSVWKQLKVNPMLKRYLVAFFVYSMGVQTVMLVATHFGSEEIKMEGGQLIITILIIQFVAIGGAYLFSALSARKGNLFTLQAAVLVWALICLGTYFFVYTPFHFYIVAALVGLVMGGIQSLSRSTYSKLLPETTDHASFFSFYDVTEKLSIVFGMVLFGIINHISGTMRQPVIILVAFFVVGFLLLGWVRKTTHNGQGKLRQE